MLISSIRCKVKIKMTRPLEEQETFAQSQACCFLLSENIIQDQPHRQNNRWLTVSPKYVLRVMKFSANIMILPAHISEKDLGVNQNVYQNVLVTRSCSRKTKRVTIRLCIGTEKLRNNPPSNSPDRNPLVLLCVGHG